MTIKIFFFNFSFLAPKALVFIGISINLILGGCSTNKNISQLDNIIASEEVVVEKKIKKTTEEIANINSNEEDSPLKEEEVVFSQKTEQDFEIIKEIDTEGFEKITVKFAFDEIVELELIDEKFNPSKTRKYKYFNGNENKFNCGLHAGINCILQIVDTNSSEVIASFRGAPTSDKPEGHYWGSPVGWFNDDTVITKKGFGDGCVSATYYSLYNIQTKKANILQSFTKWCESGDSREVQSGGKRYFFDITSDRSNGKIRDKLDIYRIKPCSTSGGGRSKNECDFKIYVCTEETCHLPNNSQEMKLNSSVLELKKEFRPENEEGSLELFVHRWDGLFFGHGDKIYQYLPEENEIIEIIE